MLLTQFPLKLHDLYIKEIDVIHSPPNNLIPESFSVVLQIHQACYHFANEVLFSDNLRYAKLPLNKQDAFNLKQKLTCFYNQ